MTLVIASNVAPDNTSSSAIAERPRCRVGQFWPKVEDDILSSSHTHVICFTIQVILSDKIGLGLFIQVYVMYICNFFE